MRKDFERDDNGVNISSETASAGGLISVRIVHIDHYMQSLSGYSASAPFQAAWLTHDTTISAGVGVGMGGSGDNMALKSSVKVPVIRIFGTTPGGQHCCVHIHGLRPYLYVTPPSDAARSPHILFEYATSLRAALEAALRAAFGTFGAVGGVGMQQQNTETTTAATPLATPDAIADIQPVPGHSIYGFSYDSQIFLKVSLYSPMMVSRVATLLTRRALPPPFDKDMLTVHSAHIPFVLQFLTDFSLAGMDFVHFSSCKFRQPLPLCSSNNATGRESTENKTDVEGLMRTPAVQRVFNDRLDVSTCPSLFWPFRVPKRSTSAVEFDAFGNDILNPRVKPANCHTFVSRTLATLWQEERLRTGVLPPRIPSPVRPVCAGAHLSHEDARQMLREVLFPSYGPDDRDSNDALPSKGLEGSEAAEGELTQSVSSSSNVWNYLDASFPDEDEALSHVPPFEDEPLNGDLLLEDGDDRDDIDQTWRDIADCTPLPQNDTKPQKNPDYGQSPPTAQKRSFNAMTGFAAKTPTTPFCIRGASDAITPFPFPSPTPTPSQRPIRFFKMSTKPPPVSTVITNLPPIEWSSPFYSSTGDYLRANCSSVQFVVRKSGAQGFPSFPLPFPIPPVPVQPLVSYLTPTQKPPTLSGLRSRAYAASAKDATHSGAIDSHAPMFAAIDSAGRRIQQDHVDPRALSSTPDTFISQSPGWNCDIEDLLDSPCLDSAQEESSDEGDERCPSVKHNRETPDSIDDVDTAVITRPLSPKYDETFQLATVNVPSCKSGASSSPLFSLCQAPLACSPCKPIA